jgi:DNA topoisomerase-1
MRTRRAASGKRCTDPVDSRQSARAAGLRYVSDDQPGFRRVRHGRGFSYLDIEGRCIREARELARIRGLAIPPAWTDIWICPLVNGHLQVTARDARGRKQYRYHPRWREVRDTTKYERMVAFGAALPSIRQRVATALSQPGLPREKVLAAIVRLLETTLIRVGNEAYARANGSFGLTTLRNQHVEITPSTLRFRFRGKSGKEHRVKVSDRRLARVIQRCQDLPGQTLFEYIEDDGQPRVIDSGDVNGYLREITGQEFTAKDFRTWGGTMLAASALGQADPSDSANQSNRQVIQTIDLVAGQLGNTRAVCRQSYIHPAIIAAYLDGALPRQRPKMAAPLPYELSPDEHAALEIVAGQQAEHFRATRSESSTHSHATLSAAAIRS